MAKKSISRVNFGLPVSLKKEGSAYVAYTPALDISTYGKTKADARKNFEELVTIFFEEFQDDTDALDVVLSELGWTKQRDSWNPPKIENEIQDVKVSLAV